MTKRSTDSFILSLKLCLWMLFLCTYQDAYSFQHLKKTTTPLAEVLKQISSGYHVNFLYEEHNISSRRVIFDIETMKGKRMEDVLTALLKPVGLSWSKIDSSNYSIFPISDQNNSTNSKSIVPSPNGLLDSLTLPSDTIPSYFGTHRTSGTKMLKEVKITSTGSILQRKNDGYVFNVDKSILAEGASVLEMMDKLPGVQLSQSGQLTINGKSGINILIDGKSPLLSPSDINNLLKGMPSNSVEKIELLTNPSARYDAAGSAGIINIIRKKNRKDGLNGSAGIGYGQGKYDRENGSFNLSFKNRKYNLYINNSYLAEKTYITALAISTFYDGSEKTGIFNAHNNDIRKSRTFLPVVGLELNVSKKTVLTLSGSGQVQLYKGLPESYTDIFNQNNSQTSKLGFKNNVNRPTHNYSFGSHLVNQRDTSGREFSADLDYSNYHTHSDQNISNTVYDPQDIYLNSFKNILDQASRLNIYSAKADYIYPISATSKLELGLKSSYVDNRNNSSYFEIINEQQLPDPSISNNFKYTENINAAYISYSNAQKRLNYQAGLRAEQTKGLGNQLNNTTFRQHYLQLFPSANFKYKLDDQQSISLSSGRKIDRPEYIDFNPTINIVNATAYIQGDPNLKPQLSFTNEMVYAYQNAFFITLNYTHYSQYITYWVFPEASLQNKDDQTVVSRPVNIDHANAYSINFSYIKKLSPWWTVNNSVTGYENVFNGIINNYNINHQGVPSFSFSTNHAFTITDKIGAEANFRYANKSQIGSSVYKSNSNFSLGIKTRLMKNKASLSLNATDIFHNQNFIWTSNTGSIVESRNVRIDSRAIKLNFTYNFGKPLSKGINLSSGSDDEKNRARRN